MEKKPFDAKIVGGSLHGLTYLLRKHKKMEGKLVEICDALAYDSSLRLEARKIFCNIHEKDGYNVDHVTDGGSKRTQL